MVAMRWCVVCVALAACGDVSEKTVDARVADTAPDMKAIDAPTCVQSPTSLRARWHADGNTNEVTGVYAGTAAGSLAYTAGKHGMAFAFDGVDDAITADASDQLYPPGSFTAEAWVKTSTLPASYATLLQKYDCGGSDGCGASDWALYITTAGYPQFELRVVGGNGYSLTASTSLVTDGAWHHIVGVRDVPAAMGYLYVDGQLAVSSVLGTSFLGALMNDDAKSDPLTFGVNRTSGIDTYTYAFIGAIDEPAYYIAALDAQTISAIYQAPDGWCP